jgi:hypothetical protein
MNRRHRRIQERARRLKRADPKGTPSGHAGMLIMMDAATTVASAIVCDVAIVIAPNGAKTPTVVTARTETDPDFAALASWLRKLADNIEHRQQFAFEGEATFIAEPTDAALDPSKH